MSGKIILTYLHHSGFMAAGEKTLLIFDYWQGEEGGLPAHLRLTEKDFSKYEKILVFVSHAHPDHYDPVIYSWNKEGIPISYIVSDDMPVGTRGKHMKAGETFTSGDIEVMAFDSTDIGVSFLVRIEEVSIFHAGDLNMWHWREESTLRQITQAENDFYAAVEPIAKQKVDLCMFPVDPRMGGLFDAGAHHFIMAVKPRLFVPMHWQSRPEVAIDFVHRGRTKSTDILALTKPRESAEITFSESKAIVRVIAPSVDILAGTLLNENSQPASRDVQLTAYSPEDPFSDTDLPVEMDEK